MRVTIAIRELSRFVKFRLFSILGRKKPYILQLPPELLQEIMSLLWVSASNESEEIKLMNCLPLVCKTIAMAFYQASPQDIKFTSQDFYEYWISRISKFNSSHPANTRRRSFHFYVDCPGKEGMCFPFDRGPLRTFSPEDALVYFLNGKEFHVKGLFPNLTNLFISVHNCWINDPYEALFPCFMPRTISNLHINYTFSPNPGYKNPRGLYRLKRRTPIPYPSTPHHLKRLTVTGLHGRIDIARLWESLFEVEELLVDGEVLSVGKNVPWALSMTQACDMLQLGCRGIGWNWGKRRPCHPTDLTLVEEYGHLEGVTLPSPAKPPVKHKHRGLLDPEDSFRQIRRSKSFSYTQDLLTRNIERTACPKVNKRTKSIVELPMIDFPYDEVARPLMMLRPF